MEKRNDIFVKPATNNPKINPELLIPGNSSEIQSFFKGSNSNDNQIYAYIYLKEGQEKNIPQGLNILAISDNIISTKIPSSQIESIANLPQVSRIDLPISGKLFDVNSEGVLFSFANEMHSRGITGNGIKIAIIDSGFFTSNSEISSNVAFTNNCSTFGTITCADTSGNSHGTAVAEIVVDMAPNSQLYLYSTGNAFGGIDLVDAQNAIDDAISKNVDIITMSFGIAGIGGDGTSGYEKDGTSSISKKVDNAKNTGILVTVAAGNSALTHWSGTYSASPVSPSSIGQGELSVMQSVMNFQPSASGVQKACLPVFDLGGSYLTQWNDWRFTNQDYDFFLYDSNLTTLIAFSGFTQSGSEFPLEVIPPGDAVGSACLVLGSFSSSQNHFFHIETTNPIDPSVGTKQRSISVPADSNGALAVGAIDQSTDQLESFSSQGPTDDSRTKPEICGPDNVLSHQSGINPFLGTSASAPHVAGAAALLLEQTPSLSVDQLRHRLIDESRFNANYSIDNLCGGNSGALSLHTAALTDVFIPLGSSSSGCENTNSCYLPFNQTISSGTQVIWYNGDSAAHTVTSGNPQDGADGKFDSSLFMSGTSFSHTFSSAGSFDYFCMVHPWMTGTITVNPTPCSVPISGDWNVTSNCSLLNNSTAPANVIVQNNSVLTIPNGITLDIDFANFNLTVKSGSGVLIKFGGRII